MTRKAWFRRRPPPRQSKLRPVSWQGYAVLMACPLVVVAPMLVLQRSGPLTIALFPIWLLLCLAGLFRIAAGRTED